MKLIASAALVLLASSTAMAQPEGGGAKTIGGDLAIVLPVGDYADVVDFAIGPLLRIEAPVGPGFVTGRAGFLWHATDFDGVTLLMFPIYGGYRYPIGTSGAYVAGELGLTIAYADSDLGDSNTETELGMTLGGGIRKGALDFRAALFLPDVGDLTGLMASVGYNFSSF